MHYVVTHQHCVQVFDPNGIDGAVADDPNVAALVLVGLAPQMGEDPIVPVPRHVHPPEHLRRGDGLRVHPELLVRPLANRGPRATQEYDMQTCIHTYIHSYRNAPPRVEKIREIEKVQGLIKAKVCPSHTFPYQK